MATMDGKTEFRDFDSSEVIGWVFLFGFIMLGLIWIIWMMGGF